MSKRILSMILTLTLVLGSVGMVFADTANTETITSVKEVTDVVGTQYEKAVLTLGKLGVIEGYPDNTFRPGQTITRAEFAAITARIRGLETAAKNSVGNTAFTDVPADHWASGYINVAQKNGLINGVGNGRFAPGSKITYEQAITMVVRALGYESAAQQRGGYPIGHLSVASQADAESGVSLLTDVDASEGSQGQPATRGLVSLLLNNALEIRKMVQVGFGDQERWVVSGTVDNAREQYLFEDLGLKMMKKQQVTKVDKKKQRVTVGKKGLKVDKDFDFVGYEGLRVTAWYNDRTDELVVVKDDGKYEAKYDVVEKTDRKKDQIKLKKADEKYDVADKAEIRYNKSISDIDTFKNHETNRYAKVIVNEYGEINWIDAYELDEMLVVKSVEKDIIKGYDRKEISDVDDYTIVKDGKEISKDDLDKKDLVLYDSSEEFAVVVTDVRDGEIDRVYTDAFKFEGTTYDNKDKDGKYDPVQHIVGDNLEDVDEDVLEEMKDNGKVKVHFSFDDKPLFVDGDAEDVASSYAMLESNSTLYRDRGTDKYTFDVLNAKGEVDKYEVKKEDIEKGKKVVEGVGKISDKNTSEQNIKIWEDLFEDGKGVIVKVTTDSKSKLTKIETVAHSKEIKRDIYVDDNYAEGYKLQGNAVVFIKDGETKIKDFDTTRWSEASKKFKEVKSGTVYADKDERVVAIFADKTDGDTKTEEVVGVVTKARERNVGSRYDVIVEINGKEVEYVGKKEANADDKKDGFKDVEKLKEDIVAVLRVSKDGEEVKSWKEATGVELTVDRITSTRLTDVDGDVYDIEGKIYNSRLRDTVNANTIDKGDKVTVYFQPGSTQYIKVVQVGKHAGESGSADEELETAKAAFDIALEAARAPKVVEGKTDASILAYNAAIVKAENAAKIAKTVEEVNAAKADLKAAEALLENEDKEDEEDIKLKEGYALNPAMGLFKGTIEGAKNPETLKITIFSNTLGTDKVGDVDKDGNFTIFGFSGDLLGDHSYEITDVNGVVVDKGPLK